MPPMQFFVTQSNMGAAVCGVCGAATPLFHQTLLMLLFLSSKISKRGTEDEAAHAQQISNAREIMNLPSSLENCDGK
ncbi:hypothetical protein E2C01_094880 [Portunus trituberculatus]|uniref:Uncharacterized protein n=1 Tax=Portunus trituberculatus TaxID=210409 RepID=A0A5B7JYT3_PORTR|nr:hypothetical protein [Portunus trituberculatus]